MWWSYRLTSSIGMISECYSVYMLHRLAIWLKSHNKKMWNMWCWYNKLDPRNRIHFQIIFAWLLLIVLIHLWLLKLAHIPSLIALVSSYSLRYFLHIGLLLLLNICTEMCDPLSNILLDMHKHLYHCYDFYVYIRSLSGI